MNPDSQPSAATTADARRATEPAPAAAPLQRANCPVCGGPRAHYAFSSRGARVVQCADCRFTFRTAPVTPRLGAKELTAALLDRIGGVREVLRQVFGEAAAPAARIVEWSADGEARLEPGGDAGALALSVGQLDAFVNPLPALAALRAKLPPDRTVVFVYSDIRRAGVAAGSAAWEKLVGERNAYLDTQTALTLLYRAGFRCRGVQRLRRRVPLQHFLEVDDNSLVSSRWRRRLLRLVPGPLRRAIHVRSRSADVAIVAVPRPTGRLLVSVVVPVFNEAATVAAVLDSVLRVQFEGAEVEVVVVESNSTDGSREIVQRHASHPRVTCVFEDRPRGKGHATRLGLARARGDILLIQDADLEYDIEDYHSLVDPIIGGQEAFMLGSRHGGRSHWKLRQFQKPLLAGFYNLAHVLVTGYINLLFRLRLRDPQTMFKVCRRDCLEGISFRGNFFNFDYELLLKVVRKGYAPLEVPVNYRSRSHAEGKKIRLWRDAPLGLWMITRLRLTPLRRFLSIGGRVE